MSVELLRRRRALMLGENGPKIKIITVGPVAISAGASKTVTLLSYDFKIGASYKLEWETTAYSSTSGGKIKIDIPGGPSTGDLWYSSSRHDFSFENGKAFGTWEFTYSSQATTEKINFFIGTAAASGTVSGTLTETIN